MRVLITGADGFIGRALARAVAAQGPAGHLVLTDRQISDAPFGAVAMAGDLTSSAFLSKLTEGGFDLVYHLASMPGSMAEAGHGTDVNLTAPLNLAQAVARVSKGARFVFASSIAVATMPMKSTMSTCPPMIPKLTR
jgi:nucleoside-diphosphate-sugar epimerase